MFSFNSREKKELIAGTLIFVFVGITMIPGMELAILIAAATSLHIGILSFIVGASLIIFPLWLFHELGHKFSAQYYGLRSEFHLYPNFAFLSLISALFSIKFIAPGAVHVRGNSHSDISARIAMAGPLVNILLGGIFLALSAFIGDLLGGILSWAGFLSINIALFNLIPLSVLDGAKIYRWNFYVFLVLFGSSLILYIFYPYPYGIYWRL